MSRYPKLILASQSPRRQELLRNITPDFTVQVSRVEENLAPGTSPGEAVEQLALRKAQAVLRLQPDPEDCIVIGSDTVVAIDGRILGKPRSREECLGMLEALSGRAAELPHIALEEPTSILGRSTIEAMRAGALYGNAGMIDSVIQRMEEAAKPASAVVMTGSQAELIRKYCKRSIVYDENLILDGLYVLYQKNSGPHERRKKK